VNALIGLTAYMMATDDKTFHVQGGTVQLISSAWNQANDIRAAKCSKTNNVLSLIPKHVSTVVGSIYGFDLHDDQGALIDRYDIVILSVPISSAKVEFLIKSHMDETAVLQQMPLGGLIENEEGSIQPDHEGHSPLPRRLPAAVSRPYVKVVTTLVRKATLQKEYWFGDATAEEWSPRQIYMTATGKVNEYNVTGVFQVATTSSSTNSNTGDGTIYKVCSSQKLSLDILRKFFGPAVEVITEYEWDASPDYQGRGDTTDFLIYDGATGFHGHTKAGALYYPSALELTFPTLEANAMGAKAVAKLIAKRLGWIDFPRAGFDAGEEL
jgi:hypothetical protein